MTDISSDQQRGDDQTPVAQGESAPAAIIARLEAAVASLKSAVASASPLEAAPEEGSRPELIMENARLKAECERVTRELDSLRTAYDALRKRSDSAGLRITRSIRELEDMLGENSSGEGANGSGHR